MKRLAPALALALAGVLQVAPASACSVSRQWRPPTPQQAFDAAQVVVHARVRAQSGRDDVAVKVEVLRVLKGTFSGTTVMTGSSSMCGMPVADGVDYVFFFPKGQGYSVTFATQPAGLSAAEVLALLPREAQQNSSPAPLPELPAPTGQFLQSGYRRMPPTTNDSEPLVNYQIDVGTPERCTSGIEAMKAAGQIDQSMGGTTAWCSATSAGDAQLRAYFELRNKANGKQRRVETQTDELCRLYFDAMAGSIPNDKIEVVTPCRMK